MSILQWRTGNKLYKNALMWNKAAHYDTGKMSLDFQSLDIKSIDDIGYRYYK